jgi:putative transposase
MPNYRRLYRPGGCWFFTANLLDRKATLLTDHIDLLRDAIGETKSRFPFHIDAIVILPDHLHTIWTLPEGDHDFSVRWRRIKASFSKSLPKTEWIDPNRTARGERGIWQRRFWERLIEDDDAYDRCVDYIYFNPVAHGHVQSISDWPHSSFHRDQRIDESQLEVIRQRLVGMNNTKFGERGYA